MNRHRPALILALSACFFSGCQRETVDTRAQDERAIREADAATLKAAQTKDVDGAVANYADDASWLPPNAPMMNGKVDIRAGWSKLIGSPGFNIDWQIGKLEIARAGDLAYTIYSYQLSLEGPNGKPIYDHGKDMAVWKKQSDGTWKMVADTFNSDLPSVAPAKSSEPKRGATKHHPSRKHRKTR
jgi:ketosteroid isomerase-like protein